MPLLHRGKEGVHVEVGNDPHQQAGFPLILRTARSAYHARATTCATHPSPEDGGLRGASP